MNEDTNSEIGMDSEFGQVERTNEASPAENKKGTAMRIIKKLSVRNSIIIGVIVVVVALGYVFKGTFIAATVDGSPISRFAVIGKLEKASGKQALDSLITQKLVVNELNKDKITVTNDEINTELKRVEAQVTAQGGTLNQALAAQGMTPADLKEQIAINLRISKLFADKIQVSDAEVTQYIKNNNLTAPKGQEAQFNSQVLSQIKNSKLSQVAGTWIESLRSKASIHYFINY